MAGWEPAGRETDTSGVEDQHDFVVTRVTSSGPSGPDRGRSVKRWQDTTCRARPCEAPTACASVGGAFGCSRTTGRELTPRHWRLTRTSSVLLDRLAVVGANATASVAPSCDQLRQRGRCSWPLSLSRPVAAATRYLQRPAGHSELH